MASRFEILEHTADLGIRVQADSLAEILRTAGQALMQIVTGATPQNDSVTHDLHITAADHEQLLVNWLSELNYLLQTRQFLFAGCQEMQLSADGCRARVLGETAQHSRLTIITEIKAITYHKAYVHCTEEGKWEAQVYLDL
jgi:SHS2 domain-containing protein